MKENAYVYPNIHYEKKYWPKGLFIQFFAKFKSENSIPGNLCLSFPDRPHPESSKNLNIEH